MLFLIAVVAVALVAGATASITGFGIGSLLTPLLAWQLGTQLAVAAVAVPHAAGTALRCVRLRRGIDWPVLWRFGLPSAAGGLAGALGQEALSSLTLTRVLGGLLVLAGITGLANLGARIRLRGAWWIFGGLLSGFFGGLVGNQGGIRSAALLGISLPPERFVATATASALIVDAVRLPVYLYHFGEQLPRYGWLLGLAIAGVLAGTLHGERILRGMSEDRFRRVVCAFLVVLGLSLIFSGLGARPVGTPSDASRHAEPSYRLVGGRALEQTHLASGTGSDRLASRGLFR
jgi:hypothetical protein